MLQTVFKHVTVIHIQLLSIRKIYEVEANIAYWNTIIPIILLQKALFWLLVLRWHFFKLFLLKNVTTKVQ